MNANTALLIMGCLLLAAGFFLGATIQRFKAWPYRK